MAKRKGWEQLSSTYRSRLERRGVNRAAYEGGASLDYARSHVHPTGIGEKAYRARIKEAETLHWSEKGQPKVTGKEAVDEAIAQGLTPRQIRELIRDRQEAAAAYRRGDKSVGKRLWARRKPYIMPWYWYHD